MPDGPRPEPWGPDLATLVRPPARPASASPAPTVLARTRPGPPSLTPAAAIPTVVVPAMAVPDDGAETTLLPSRQDAPGTTINPRRAR
jgi:hypothetical protein